MISRQNLHTHCTYCDGKDSPRSIIEEAIKLGLSSVGFSSHAYSGLVFDDCAISREHIEPYLNEISALKEEYRGRLRIYTGFEYDGMSTEEASELNSNDAVDYSIGSIHYCNYKGHCYCIDYSAEKQKESISCFSSEKDYILRFYEEVVRFAYTSDYDIVGHFDLISKFSENGGLDPSSAPVYRKIAAEALDAVAATGKIFEVNTGAMARGYRTKPYPADFLLRQLKDLGAHLVLTSDCHNKDFLTFGFEEAEDMLRGIGFRELYELTDNGFLPYRI